jgi:tRNA1Val (adenine37-N6)-methyltransferase
MNNYFEFKQFKIVQDKCAQKVSETACIQGAWSTIPENSLYALDIGSGTGLLSLMLAQRFPTLFIDAIEIDRIAFEQLNENISNSTYSNRIKSICNDIRLHSTLKLYDYIIVNPPFHETQLTSADNSKNIAWHSSNLTLEDLLLSIEKLLKHTGQCSILLPYYRKDEFKKLCSKYNFHVVKYLSIRHSDNHIFKFFVAIISLIKLELTEEIISVKVENQYSEKMNSLMHSFYMKL